MAELRGAGDGPDDGDASVRRFAADTSDGAGEARTRHEPSPRAEYADVVRHNVADYDTWKREYDRVRNGQQDLHH